MRLIQEQQRLAGGDRFASTDQATLCQQIPRRATVAAACLTLAAICAVATLPAYGDGPAVAKVQAAAAASDSSRPVSPDYIIGPGDTLQIFVWRNPDLSTQVPVRPDGKISTPLVESMVAVGKTTSELARDIETTLERYVRNPTVNVIVVTAVSAMSEVTVVGAAANPKALPYREGLHVMDAVLAVGGVSQFAAPNRSKIVRQQNGHQQVIQVRLKNLMEKGDLSQNVLMQPGDVLVIPESFF